jgi:hypothetical protein
MYGDATLADGGSVTADDRDTLGLNSPPHRLCHIAGAAAVPGSLGRPREIRPED